MNKDRQTSSLRVFKLLAVSVFGLGLGFAPGLKADVVLLQNSGVLTGTVLQQDADGVLIQTDSGTYRYPPSWIRDVKKEAAAAPHVANNGRRIPDWAQIVSRLANTGWSQGLKQVPATVISSGAWQNVPYISFHCRSGGYEVNIFGDLDQPAAVQIGALSYLKQSDEAKTNCVNFICSVLANADDRKIVRSLNWSQKDVDKNAGMTFAITLPDAPGAEGGWWVSVYNESELASERASEAELASLTQPRTAPAQPAAAAAQPMAAAQPAAAAPSAATTTNVAQADADASQSAAMMTAPPTTTTTQPGVITTYGATYGVAGWTAEELAAARPVAPAPVTYPSATGPRTDAAAAPAQAAPASTGDRVYPRNYNRAAGSYGPRRR
jgi:hypothetical protein